MPIHNIEMFKHCVHKDERLKAKHGDWASGSSWNLSLLLAVPSSLLSVSKVKKSKLFGLFKSGDRAVVLSWAPPLKQFFSVSGIL